MPIPTLPELPRIHLGQQSAKMRSWIRTRLWAQVIVALILGIATGLLLGPEGGLVSAETARWLGAWLALPGQLFLGLIAMVLVPLVFASIIGGLTGSGSGEALKRIGLRFAGFVLATTFAAAAIGITLASILRPGSGLVGSLTTASDTAIPEGEPASFDLGKAPEIISGILPNNPTASIVQGDLMAIVAFALLVGIAATQVTRDRIAPFLSVLDALLSICMTIVKWAMYLAPLAVFGMMAQLVMRIGLNTLIGVSAYVGTVLLGLFLLFLLYLIILTIFARVGPIAFFKNTGETLLLAFSTSSSTAVMPSTVQSAKKLGVPREVANLVAPLGATMNMAGTALYQSVAILFLAQMSGIELSGGQIILMTVTLVASSIGAPGTPGVSIAILVSVAAGFGIPADGMVIVMGVDRLLDMSRTSVNVAGDLTASTLLRNVAIPMPEQPAEQSV
ncbi:dicarboxylate/amino acid:cation symporter [Parasphingorhabdus cellanae]|uniref:Dicarboxylate/amino acid:cation symporter n=1 Tax=Parasphingorhabdus cellanae TaxID=2806553 RepID=A0ABX7T5B8_9SPHN|nr:dicarboxylate/amino acid:cation symporter [Parasphingorhabdus cellanae]QTD55679.1 dicarboxylate/amino acid:cation symporter [Parasphingorhabdus cellanae]